MVISLRFGRLGRIFWVEVDHDDELTPDSLAELAAAFSDPRVDFAYSNTCEIRDGKRWKYDEQFGWRYRPFTGDGQPQFECVAFEPSPRSFSKIWFAPNHVRAWRSAFYHRIGGHDPLRKSSTTTTYSAAPTSTAT